MKILDVDIAEFWEEKHRSELQDSPAAQNAL